MKTSEIVVGGVYSSGNGRVRKVVAEGDFAYAAWASDHDYVRYNVIDNGARGTSTDFLHGSTREMTRNSFSQWAKERIE